MPLAAYSTLSACAVQRRWDTLDLHLFVECCLKHGQLHITLPAALLQANHLNTACSPAATCRIICKKDSENISAVIVPVTSL